jgi:hypothetical protein
MFGKTREPTDTDTTENPITLDDFFGDEQAAAEVVQVAELHERIGQVESQVNSQFTSLAAYAQIAQEQIELARSEATATADRTEHRLTTLIERERTDRVLAGTGGTGSLAPEVTARLDALESSVAEIKLGLEECMERQRALADAITTLLQRSKPRLPLHDPPKAAQPLAGPIPDLSLNA